MRPFTKIHSCTIFFLSLPSNYSKWIRFKYNIMPASQRTLMLLQSGRTDVTIYPPLGCEAVQLEQRQQHEQQRRHRRIVFQRGRRRADGQRRRQQVGVSDYICAVRRSNSQHIHSNSHFHSLKHCTLARALDARRPVHRSGSSATVAPPACLRARLCRPRPGPGCCASETPGEIFGVALPSCVF